MLMNLPPALIMKCLDLVTYREKGLMEPTALEPREQGSAISAVLVKTAGKHRAGFHKNCIDPFKEHASTDPGTSLGVHLLVLTC